jgi:hypothetical protein
MRVAYAETISSKKGRVVLTHRRCRGETFTKSTGRRSAAASPKVQATAAVRDREPIHRATKERPPGSMSAWLTAREGLRCAAHGRGGRACLKAA